MTLDLCGFVAPDPYLSSPLPLPVPLPSNLLGLIGAGPCSPRWSEPEKPGVRIQGKGKGTGKGTDKGEALNRYLDPQTKKPL